MPAASQPNRASHSFPAIKSGNAPAGIQAQFDLTLASKRDSGFRLAVDFSVPGSGVTAIFGPSGCGKTTLLRCIAGLQKTEHGSLAVNGETWHGRERCLAAHERPIGYVFQEANLFPHLSARGNLDFAIRRAATSLSEAHVKHLIELMDIAHLLEQRPDQLSGGERQRVAIARALLVNPKLLLMDEPLAALDNRRKQDILPFLETLHSELELPILYVTHSLDEVARLADHLLLMEAGTIAAQGPLSEVLSRTDLPIDLGDDSGAVLVGTITERDEQWQLARIDLGGAQLWVRDSGEAIGATVRVRILARDVSLTRTASDQSSILNRLPVAVRSIEQDRDKALALVSLVLPSEATLEGAENKEVENKHKAGNSRCLLARISQRSVHDLNLQPGDQVWAQIKSVAILR